MCGDSGKKKKNFNNSKKPISVIFLFFSCLCLFCLSLSHQSSLPEGKLVVHPQDEMHLSSQCDPHGFSHYPCSVMGHWVPDPNPRLSESLSGFEMVEVIEAKPLIAISL